MTISLQSSQQELADSVLESSDLDRSDLDRSLELAADEGQDDTEVSHCDVDDESAKAPRNVQSGRPFPKDVTDQLEILYCRGMTGWGNSQQNDIALGFHG